MLARPDSLLPFDFGPGSAHWPAGHSRLPLVFAKGVSLGRGVPARWCHVPLWPHSRRTWRGEPSHLYRARDVYRRALPRARLPAPALVDRSASRCPMLV